MTPRKPVNADAITQPEAAEILGTSLGAAQTLIRKGVIHVTSLGRGTPTEPTGIRMGLTH